MTGGGSLLFPLACGAISSQSQWTVLTSRSPRVLLSTLQLIPKACDREKAEAADTSGDDSDSKHSTLRQQREAAENTKNKVLSSPSEGGTVAGKIRRDDVQRKRNERRASPYGDSASARRGSKSDKADGLTKERPTPGEAQVLMSLWGL